MADNRRISWLGGFILRLKGFIASTATVAECRRSGGLSFKSCRSLDSHDILLLFGHHQHAAEFRAQGISFHYSTITRRFTGIPSDRPRPALTSNNWLATMVAQSPAYQQPSLAMRTMASVIACFLGVSVRGCTEFLLARCGAEIIGLPLPDFTFRGLFALDSHATDRIGDLHLLSLLSMEGHAFNMKPPSTCSTSRDGPTLDTR
jgi:hypothetical protein